MTNSESRAHLLPTLLLAWSLLFPASLLASGLVGRWQGVGHPQVLVVTADGTLSLGGQSFRYQTNGTLLHVEGAQGSGYYQYQLQGDRLVVAGADIGTLQFQRADGAKGGGGPLGGALGKGPGGSSAPPSPAPGPAATTPGAPPSTTSPGPGGTNLFRSEAHGFQMQFGDGWRAMEKEGVLIFGHQTVPGMLIVSPSGEPIDEAGLRAAATQGYSEAGVQLTPKQPGSSKDVATGQGMGLYFPVRGTLQGTQVEGLLAGFLGPTKVAVVVAALTTPEKWSELEPHARRMIESARLFPATSKAVQAWAQELTGRKITHMWSYYSGGGGGGAYVGGSSNKEWHLCPNGTYSYSGSSNVSADAGAGGAVVSGYGQGGGQERGRWRITPQGAQGAAIEFLPQGGQGYRYVLSKQKKLGSSYMQKYFGDLKIFATEDVQCY